MKKFMKKVIVTLTAVLMASSMVLGTSAAYAADTSCAWNSAFANVYSMSTSMNGAGCLNGVDVTSLLGDLNSLGNTTPNNNVSNCTPAVATSNCTTKAAVVTAKCATAAKPCGILSCNVTSACKTNSTFVNRLNSVLTKCGVGIKKFSLPPTANTAHTSTPAPSTGTTPTATPAPVASTAPTATPTPVANTASTATPAPSAAPTPTPTNTTNTGTGNSGNIDNQTFEQQVVALVNEQRAANGLAPLTLSAKLSNVARAKSQDMHDNNYFSHTSPTYGSPFDMMKTFGISYRAAGENIAILLNSSLSQFVLCLI